VQGNVLASAVAAGEHASRSDEQKARRLRDAWDIIVRLRPTIFVVAVALALLSLPSQILELYLIDIEVMREAIFEGGEGAVRWTSPLLILQDTHQILQAVGAGLVAMIVLWLSSTHLICLDSPTKDWTKAYAALVKALVIPIAVAPIVGVLLGEINIRLNIEAIAAGASPRFAHDIFDYMLVSAALLGLSAIFFTCVTLKWLDKVAAVARPIFSFWGVALGFVLILALTADIVFSPARVPRAIGNPDAGVPVPGCAHVLADMVLACLSTHGLASDRDRGWGGGDILRVRPERQSLDRLQAREEVFSPTRG
jgi:hypothetical protein